MAKHWHPADNRPNTSKGPGEGGVKKEVSNAEAEERGGTQGEEAAGPPPNRF